MSSIKALSKNTLICGIGTVLQKITGFILLPFYTKAIVLAQCGVLDTLLTFAFFISAILGIGLADTPHVIFL